MEREIDLKEISDGRLYRANDMVKLGCSDCKGCFECCRGMGNSIILDPCDIFMLEAGLKCTFEELMAEQLELHVVDGIIQPNLKQQGADESCSFLSKEGRCSIHRYRPGFCRLFPLGRIYEEKGFSYFLQVHECPALNKTKIKIQKWLGIPDITGYEKFIIDWHYFLKDIQKIINGTEKEDVVKHINMFLLNLFYVKPYEAATDFYSQFYDRLKEAKIIWKI